MSLHRKNQKVAAITAGIAVAMVGLAYASVPLYDLFCRVTGFGGTTQVATAAPGGELPDRFVKVRFDANVNGVPWDFAPSQRVQEVQVGARQMAFYTSANRQDEPVTGTATFNVSPPRAGLYFNKIDCFCFTQQTLAAGQEVEMPVLYFIDPEFADDPQMAGVTEITLSYTFFPVDNPEPMGQQTAEAGAVPTGDAGPKS